MNPHREQVYDPGTQDYSYTLLISTLFRRVEECLCTKTNRHTKPKEEELYDPGT